MTQRRMIVAMLCLASPVSLPLHTPDPDVGRRVDLHWITEARGRFVMRFVLFCFDSFVVEHNTFLEYNEQ